MSRSFRLLHLQTVPILITGLLLERSSSRGVALTDNSHAEKNFTSFRSLEDKIDALCIEHMKKHKIPGMAYGIIYQGQLVHKNFLGLQDVEANVPVTKNSCFRIASMTKSFTAMAIVRLRDCGQLFLDDPVHQYIPEFPLSEKGHVITIRELLIMMAGLPQDDPWADRLLDWTESDLRTFLANGFTFSNTPGIAWEYSNLSYAILGLIISKVAGVPYQRYILKEICEPLGMKDTVFEYSSVPTANLAIGYRHEEEQWKREAHLHDGIFGAMGGLCSTIDDFGKYIRFHQSAWNDMKHGIENESPYQNDKISHENLPISPSSLREMHMFSAFIGHGTGIDGIPRPKKSIVTPLPDPEPETAIEAGGTKNTCAMGYGYGLRLSLDSTGVTIVRHAGGLPGFGSEWRFTPHHGGIGIVSLANRTYAPMGILNTEILELLLKENVETTKPKETSSLLENTAKELIKVILEEKEFSSKTDFFLSPNFFADKPRHIWDSEIKTTVTKLAGENPNVSFVVGEIIPINNLRGKFLIKVDDEISSPSRIEVFFTLTPEKVPRVQALELKILK